MIFALIIVSAALLLMIAEYISYRRQIADICRQFERRMDENSNTDIGVAMNRSEIKRLRDCSDRLFERSRQERAAFVSQELRTRELITDVSHDIRTPLASLDGYFNLLSKAETYDEREKYTEKIKGRIHILTELLEQLFTYAKLQNNSYQLENEPFDCNQIMCETLLSFYEEFRKRGIEPDINIDDVECIICGSRTAFVRVVQNILRNAMIHGDGTIYVDMHASDGKASIIFANGIKKGITIDTERVFERFYTQDKSRTNASSGLGLPVAKQLTEAMGGAISVDIINQRFTITLEFPAAVSAKKN